MRVLFVIGFAFLISACGDKPSSETAKSNIVCLQGVKYYKFSTISGNAGHGYLAPVFNKSTKQVETCK